MYTVKAAAERIGASEDTIRRWLRTGKLNGVMPGGTKLGYRIPESEIERIERGEPPPHLDVRPARLTSPRPLPESAAIPGLQPLLDRAAHYRRMGNLVEAARWERLADQLLAGEEDD